jgi:DNA-binding CsgD family transcriptional regulator
MPTGRDFPRPTPQTGEIHLNEPIHDAERALEVLLAVHGSLRAWASFESGAERLLRDLALPLGCEAGALWLARGDALVARALWSAPPVDRAALRELLWPLRIERGTGLAGRVWMRAEPIRAEAESDDVVPLRSPVLGELRASLGLPALAGAEVIAVLELYSQSPPVLGQRVMGVLGVVAHELGAFFDRRRAELSLSPLTAREVEVLTLAACGLPVTSIGERLSISRGTVKSHLEHIYSKLEVANRTAAVARALRAGLIA